MYLLLGTAQRSLGMSVRARGWYGRVLGAWRIFSIFYCWMSVCSLLVLRSFLLRTDGSSSMQMVLCRYYRGVVEGGVVEGGIDSGYLALRSAWWMGIEVWYDSSDEESHSPRRSISVRRYKGEVLRDRIIRSIPSVRVFIVFLSVSNLPGGISWRFEMLEMITTGSYAFEGGLL